MSALVAGDRPRERMSSKAIAGSLGVAAAVAGRMDDDPEKLAVRRDALKTAAHALMQIWEDLDGEPVKALQTA